MNKVAVSVSLAELLQDLRREILFPKSLWSQWLGREGVGFFAHRFANALHKPKRGCRSCCSRGDLHEILCVDGLRTDLDDQLLGQNREIVVLDNS